MTLDEIFLEIPDPRSAIVFRQHSKNDNNEDSQTNNFSQKVKDSVGYLHFKIRALLTDSNIQRIAK
jgi:hypothetical protein